MGKENSKPSRLYHGTPYEIHSSSRPFLDPYRAKGRDEGDPTSPHVMGTPDELAAKIFAIKDDNCRTFMIADSVPIVVFSNSAPKRDTGGWVYEISADGFTEIVVRGRPTGKWAMLAEDMPFVTDHDGTQVRGISLKKAPVRPVTLTSLIEESGLQVYLIADGSNLAYYSMVAREANATGNETSFLQETVERGWLKNITDALGNV